MPTAGLLVAVIDDDSAFVSLIRDFLEEEGFEVVAVDEEKGAFDVVSRRTPAVVILDIRMQRPESGKQILDQIRQDPETSRIPVIVATADMMFLRENEAFLHSRHALILAKPFDLDDLLSLVKRASSGEMPDILRRPDGEDALS